MSGYVQPELRLRRGRGSSRGSGGIGLYRVTALGNLRSNVRYALSASNWFEDDRRVFQNDIGPHDFSAVNEAYLELDGGRGLTVDLGRMQNRWGPGARGRDPAFRQRAADGPAPGRVSLQPRRRVWAAATTSLNSWPSLRKAATVRYFAARRIELAVSPRLTADLQEGYKASTSRALVVSLLPDFYSGKNANLSPVFPGVAIRNLEDYYNAVLDFGLTYEAGHALRVYGQFALDDLQTPGRHSGTTPRKIAYLVGFAAQPLARTGITAEYLFADPTTYSFHTPRTSGRRARSTRSACRPARTPARSTSAWTKS